MMDFECRYVFSQYEEMLSLQNREHVFLVRHRESGKIYVKKVLQIYDKQIYLYLQAHPSPYFPVIQYLSEDTTEKRLYLLEEYVEGPSLEQYLDSHGPLALPAALAILEQLCLAVLQLHSQTPPIIHRDLKPSNIIISEDLSVRLIDFNIAHYFALRQNQETAAFGTHGFAAPEQYTNKPADRRSDIYALGVLLNYLLTGQLPSVELCPKPAAGIVQRCTEFDPDDRYPTVSALLRQLRHLQSRGISRRRFLPPGFRSGNPLKMLFALFGYAMILYITFSLRVYNAAFQSLALPYLYLHRMIWLLAAFGCLFLWTNYGDLQRFLPLCRTDKKRKYFGCMIYSIIYVALLTLLLVILMQ